MLYSQSVAGKDRTSPSADPEVRAQIEQSKARKVGMRTDNHEMADPWLLRVFIQMIRKGFPGHWKFSFG